MAELNSSDPVASVSVYVAGLSTSFGTYGQSAGFGVYWGMLNPLNVSQKLTDCYCTSRAELLGALRALKDAVVNEYGSVRIHTDSEVLYDAATNQLQTWKENDWKTEDGVPIENKDDFILLDALYEDIDVQWTLLEHDAFCIEMIQANDLAKDGASKCAFFGAEQGK